MPTVESVNEFEKAIACVEFALRKLEDVWNVEAALLSGATSVSEAGDVMVSVKSLLRKIQLVLVEAAPAPAPCWKDDDDHQQGAVFMELITALVDVCICTERVICNFSTEVGIIIPTPSLPQVVKRISNKPVDLFSLNKLAIEMKNIQSLLRKMIDHDALMYLTNHTNAALARLRAFPQPVRPSPVPSIDETELVGYESLQKGIIEKLIDATIPQRLQVAILGPEGAGKTALVQTIYQSILVKNHFDVCFWLLDMNCFDNQHPELFKPIDILRKMLITLELGYSSDSDDEKDLILRIHEYLKGKIYLVVIDNVQRYNIFKQALPSENNGSRVLVACREVGNYERVCLDLDPEVRYHLPSLSYEKRLKLIFRKPFEEKKSVKEYPGRAFPESLFRKPIARIILASHWSDSPMTLQLLSGHILFNQPFSHNHVLGDIAATANFSEILTTIYNKLPIVLRTCFSYMAALFPVNYLIHTNSLIRLWIAEGMIPKDHGRTMEQTAELYLEELIQRGFVRGIWAYYHNQPNQSNRVVVIHPMLQSGLFDDYTIINNNCPPIKVIPGEDAVDIYGYYGEPKYNPANLEHLHRLALHSSYVYDQFSSFQKGKTMNGFKYPNLHSLFFFGSVAPLMFSEFGFLRVLTVFQARILFCEEEKSCWLEGLINLRYLGFIVCWVEGSSLGKKLSRLTNLQTLDLSESSVSGLSEFMEHNTKINVIGPIKEELQRCWSPLPDVTKLICQQ